MTFPAAAVHWFAHFQGEELWLLAEPMSDGRKAFLYHPVPKSSPLYEKIAALAPGMVEIDFEAGTVRAVETR